MRTMRVMIALVGLLVFTAPAFAQRRDGRYYPEREGAFRIHFGAFQPDGESDYWRDKEEDFSGSIDDFENVSFGLDFLLPLNNRMSLIFSGSVFEGDTTNAYRDFEDNFGDRIRHDTTLALATGTVGLVVHLTPPDVVIQPYLGAGGGTYFWELEESGDFIDFDSSDLEVFSADLRSRRKKIGGKTSMFEVV